MIVDILALFIVVYALVYLVFAVLIMAGEKRLKPASFPVELPRVSVVICARNEEHNLPRTLNSILKLEYPRDRLEVLLVDDESEDRTGEICREYAERDRMFRVLSTAGEPHDLDAKQRPLNLGIRESAGEIVCITDADIEVHPGWIKGHLSAYDETIGIVGATTRVDTSSGKLFDRLQCSDLITKHAVAMGCSGLGFPITVMGNNMSFRREAFDAVGGFFGVSASIVEDMALMNAIVRRTRYTSRWVADERGVVVSAPERNLAAFIRQRLRWVYELSDFSFVGRLMMFIEGMMIVSFITSLVMTYWTAKPLAVVCLLWIAGYLIMLSGLSGARWSDAFTIPAMLVFQMYYGVIFFANQIFGKKQVVWKGRVFGER